MKRRQYAIYVEEKNGEVIFDSVLEFNTMEEAIDLMRGYVEGNFWYEEDCLPDEYIKVADFNGLRKYLYFLNKEDKHPYIDIYCKAMSKLYRVKHLKQLRPIVDQLRGMLEGLNSNVKIYLDSRKYDGCGWNGMED